MRTYHAYIFIFDYLILSCDKKSDVCISSFKLILFIFQQVMEANLNSELPFLVVERILVKMVSEGAANRQECHERLRKHSHEAAAEIKLKGLKNSLMDKLLNDDYFTPIHSLLPNLLDPSYMIGRAVEQVMIFITPALLLNINNSSIKFDCTIG